MDRAPHPSVRPADAGDRVAPTSPATSRDRAWGLLQRLAFIGVTAHDSADVRVQKVTLTLSASIVTGLAVIWVGTYLALGLPVSAAIPFTYQVVSLASLAVFARSKDYGVFRFSQIVLMLLLPFLLQWSLGGYAASSAVSLWALIAVFGALFFYSAAGALPWFMAFVVLTVLSGVADPWLSQSAADIPSLVRTAFFVFDILGVSLTAFVLLQFAVRARDSAHAESEGLLLNVLPGPIVDRLKREPGVIAERHEQVTILFADVADFTRFAEGATPEHVVGVLDDLFSAFDALVLRHELEKIKTIGYAYMAAGGLLEPRTDDAGAVVELALDMQAELLRLREARGLELRLRIGIDRGPVVAGVIGRQRLVFDVWGDTVNTASRMESHGIPDRIQVTETIHALLADRYDFEDRGEVEIKGKGARRTYLVIGRREARVP